MSMLSSHIAGMIALVRKTQCFLKVPANPFCQLGGQPAQNWVAGSVHIIQPVWRGRATMHNWQKQARGESFCWKLESAGFKKVGIKTHTTG